jgi:hypothetical protein
MKSEKFCSHLSTYFKRHIGFRSKRTFTVLRANVETEATQENIQHQHELDEGDPGFQLLTGSNFCSDVFVFIFISTAYVTKFSIYLFS